MNDYTLFSTEPVAPTTRDGARWVRTGDHYGERGYVECRECEETVVAGDSDVYEIDGEHRHICGWCSGRMKTEEEEEHMAKVTHKEFHETIKAIARSAGKRHWLTQVDATEYLDGELIIEWKAYIDGVGWRTGTTAQGVVELMRGASRGEEVDLGSVGEPPNPRAA